MKHLRRHGTVLAGIVAAATVALGLAAMPARVVIGERSLDAVLALAARLFPAPPAAIPVAVVDVDAAALGPWPWPRARLAGLVEASLRAGARAVALDMLLEGDDRQAPATLARDLAVRLDRPDLAAWAATLADGNAALAAAIGGRPVALGFAIDPDGGERLPPALVLSQGRASLAGIWRAPGARAPAPGLRDAAGGLGALPLPGDADGVVRRVPLLVGVAGRVQPGLAAEAVRLAEGAAAFGVDGPAGTLAIGGATVRLAPDGMLRLVPWDAVPVFPAGAVLRGEVTGLRGAIVFIGSSAPALGGLRATAREALTPSVVIQAAAARQILRGVAPAPGADWVVPALAAAAAGGGILLAHRVRPAQGALAAILLGASTWLGAAWAAGAHGWLVDPLPPSLLLATGFIGTAVASAARMQWREAGIRRRFAQHLAPQVVALIAANPAAGRLPSERREVTALFTDIEDFTALTRRAGPEALVAVLDGYFEGVAGIVHRHGGMIDKLVGDAVHAFFNMPLDQPDHAPAAVRCAIAVHAWTETYRARGLAAALGMGRTRIGIETGPALVGEVGLRAKLDYTAHGDPVNAAARLEAANKDLGTAICVGPGTAARCPAGMLRAVGQVHLRGQDAEVTVFSPL